MVKKKPRFGALPTLNMPKKSHDTVKSTARTTRLIVRDVPMDVFNVKRYKSFKELTSRINP